MTAVAPADLVIIGGAVVSMAEDMSMTSPEPHAIAVRDGRILAVGSLDNARQALPQASERLPLRLACPAFTFTCTVNYIGEARNAVIQHYTSQKYLTHLIGNLALNPHKIFTVNHR